jgi:branched-chain amino acid transport system substrate-binding protein
MKHFVRAVAAAAVIASLLGRVPVAAADLPPIKIGLVYSFTGAGTYSFTPDIAIAAFLKTHGDTVAGRKIEIIRRDDGGAHPDIAKRMAQELIVQENVDYLIGGAFTPTSIAIAGVSTAAKKPYFMFNAATSGIIANQPYSTRWGFTEAQSTLPLAQWAVKNGIKSVYTLVSDYAPGIDAQKTFEDGFTAGGGTVLGSVRVPNGSTDFSSYILKVRDAKPQATFTFTDLAGTAFLKSFNDAGLMKTQKLLTTADFATENNFPGVGDSAIGVISSYNYTVSHDSAMNRDFVKAFLAADTSGKYQPDFMAVAAWDVMSAIYKIVAAQKGSTDPELTMASVKGFKMESPRGPIVIDPSTRDIVENFYLRRVEKKNDKLVNVEFLTIPMVRDPNQR